MDQPPAKKMKLLPVQLPSPKLVTRNSTSKTQISNVVSTASQIPALLSCNDADKSIVKVTVTADSAWVSDPLVIKIYYLPAATLRRVSDYFTKALTGLFRGTAMRELNFEVGDIAAFDYFVTWLFTGEEPLQPESCATCMTYALEIFKLGDHIRCVNFQNMAVKVLFLPCRFIHLASFRKFRFAIYESTVSSDHPLRRFAMMLAVRQCFSGSIPFSSLSGEFLTYDGLMDLFWQELRLFVESAEYPSSAERFLIKEQPPQPPSPSSSSSDSSKF
ncbi:MAG: hypothetical protein M1821_004954 [Bathelium mastoideum]|nr:MAG: hypothetical protein M1821_004954 [Bathelium mastoideum]